MPYATGPKEGNSSYCAGISLSVSNSMSFSGLELASQVYERNLRTTTTEDLRGNSGVLHLFNYRDVVHIS